MGQIVQLNSKINLKGVIPGATLSGELVKHWLCKANKIITIINSGNITDYG